MYFDDYSTSFQSLYNPMYNVQTNYNANMNGGMGGGYGMGMGMGMMGYDPMMNVGIGQFKDQLLLGAEKENNYHTRPVANYKKKDDAPLMLGIFATALGATALLLASKGKFKGLKLPKWGKKGAATAPVPTVPTTPVSTLPVPTAPLPTVPATPVTTAPVPTVPTTPVSTLPITTAATSNIGKNNANPLLEDLFTYRNTGKPSIDYVKQVKPKTFEEVLAADIAEAGKNPNLKPLSEIIAQGNKTNLVPQLPAQKMITNGMQTTPANVVPLPTAATTKPLVITGTPKKYVEPSLQSLAVDTPFEEITKVNQNLLAHRPELKKFGEIVYTTHTPATLQNGYSIGANAKGADKLLSLTAPTNRAVAQTEDFIRPVVTRKGNRFANINGAQVQNKLANYGLELDTKAFAKLPSNLHKEFNNVILNGTDGQIKAITCDPRFEKVFQIAYV